MKKICFVIPILVLAASFAYFIYYNENSAENSAENSTNQGEIFESHIKYACESVEQIKSSWIPYYHRHKRHEELTKVIKNLVESDILHEEYLHFFALLVSSHPEKGSDLQELSKMLAPKQKIFIEKILAMAQRINDDPSYSMPLNATTVSARYAFTGDIAIITDYASMLDSKKYTLDDSSISEVEDFLLLASKTYYPVYIQLEFLEKRSSGAYQKRLHSLYSSTNKKVYKQSYNSWYTADNYRKNGEYKKAYVAIVNGLKTAPDNPYLYRLAGEILLAQDQLKEAMKALQYSKKICPDAIKVGLLFKIAEVYAHYGDLDGAIEQYKEALLIEPKKPSTLGNIGWAYNEVGDLKNAEKYYRETLLNNPNHSVEENALSFFKLHNIPPPTVEESLEDLLMNGKFQKLETIFKKAFVDKEVDENGIQKIYSMFDKLDHKSNSYTSTFDRYIKAYSEWITHSPDSFLANAASGMLYIEYAWNARGSGYANTISEKGSEQFHGRLRQAAQYLTKAYQIDPGVSIVPVKMMIVAKLHPDWPDSKVEEWFQKAVKTNPSDCKAYTTKFLYMAPQWGGSLEEQFTFARETYHSAPKDSMAPVILSKAHWYAAYYRDGGTDYFKQPQVWEELKELQTELIKRFPNSNERHNWFAKSASLAGDFEVARQEFNIIGDNWIKEIWSSKEDFDYYKNLAQNSQ